MAVEMERRWVVWTYKMALGVEVEHSLLSPSRCSDLVDFPDLPGRRLVAFYTLCQPTFLVFRLLDQLLGVLRWSFSLLVLSRSFYSWEWGYKAAALEGVRG